MQFGFRRQDFGNMTTEEAGIKRSTQSSAAMSIGVDNPAIKYTEPLHTNPGLDCPKLLALTPLTIN